MNKNTPKEKYVFIIAVVVIFLLFFSFWMLFYSNKQIISNLLKYKDENSNFFQEEEIKIVYEKDRTDLISNYFSIKERGNLNLKSIQRLEDKMLAMIVNKEHKDSHLKLFLDLERMKKALIQGDDSGFEKVQKDFEQLIS